MSMRDSEIPRTAFRDQIARGVLSHEFRSVEDFDKDDKETMTHGANFEENENFEQWKQEMKVFEEWKIAQGTKQSWEWGSNESACLDGEFECYNESQRLPPDQVLDMYQVIHHTVKLFKRHKMWLVAHGGTLIGAVRNSGIIPHDNDADFNYLLEEFNESTKAFRDDIEKNDLVLSEFWNATTGSSHKTIGTKSMPYIMDLFPLVKDDTHVSGFSLKTKWPASITEEGEMFNWDFGSTTVPVPRQWITERFLTSEIGANWDNHVSCGADSGTWHPCFLVKDKEYDLTGRAMPDGPLKDPL